MILVPVIVLIAWSMVIWALMVAVRMPALRKAGIDVMKISGSRPGALDGVVADKAQWPAHNYMHLVEQPTLFYAVIFSLALLHAGGGINATLAWAYVGLRIVHSIVQVTSNRILYRFSLFALSSFVLIALTVQAFRAAIHAGLLPF
ncbi:MAPEG family protein [Sphingomonas sp. LB-2]|uniref:MAPEG family protein n=1 Tax=Sphingomonas caeni TaxID=2984949 RepID=UPI00222F9D17|nr:MAPEG family protein [Sphingomonas caeni]MCW3848385.1 MAPEG family protein [Sphingomonas caeni]